MKICQGKGIGSSSIAIEVGSAISLLKSLRIDNPTVFDVGANIGLYTEVFLKLMPKALIFAFEPSTGAQKAFENRFNNHANVHLIPIALGNKNQTLNLYSDENGSGLASLTKRRVEHFGIKFSYVERVKCQRLEDWSMEHDTYPDFIKIDVEGHELDVLNGADSLLSKVSVIQFEFGGCNIDTRTFFQDFWYCFISNGFLLYRVTLSGLIAIQSYSEEDEYFLTTNYLAVNKSKL